MTAPKLGPLVGRRGAGEQRKDWDQLRNKYAHGGHLREEYLQQALDIKDSVLVLFYHLIFFAIGYRGKFADYSKTDWPIQEYSPAPPALSGPKP